MGEEGKVIVQTICEGGAGGEAEVWVQARNSFPGIGGVLTTGQLVATAWRKEYDSSETAGENLFLKHLIVKKLDDYFCRIGRYVYPHIARPLGSEKNTYFYEWVQGVETFSWMEIGESGAYEPVILMEWSEFTGAFEETGIAVGHDAADSDNANISQNIIHQLCRLRERKLNLFWKRIDFGSRSLPINYDKVENYADRNSKSLREVLGEQRYWLLVYALKALRLGAKLDLRDRIRLEELVMVYRISTLRQNRPRLAIQ